MAKVNAHRLAAYRVAGLPRVDRNWILAQLNATERETLEKQLLEVPAIGNLDGLAFEDILQGGRESLLDINSADFSGTARQADAKSIETIAACLGSQLKKTNQDALVQVLDELSPFFVALALSLYQSIDTRYVAQCRADRARMICRMAVEIKHPLPSGLSEHVQSVLLARIQANNQLVSA